MSETASTPDSSSDTQGTPSSSVTETTSAPAPAAPADSSAPPSSSGTDAPSPSSGDSRQSDREGLLAAVRSVVDKAPAPASEGGDTPSEGDAATGDSPTGDMDAASGAQGDQRADEPSQPPGEANLADPTEGELRKLRPQTRQRREHFIRQRNEARTALEAVQPELEGYRQFHGRMQQHGLDTSDIDATAVIAAAVKRQDWQGFLDGITPYVMVAQERLGLRIAQDLQAQVDDGLISDEAARELTRTRHRAVEAEERLKASTAAQMSDTQLRAVQSIRSSVEQWETSIRTRDPDYAHKADTVRRFSQGLLQERGTPQTPEQAVALVQAAYEEANRMLAQLRPRPAPTQRTPSSVHVATGGASAEPTTPFEVAKLALAKMRRAS